MRAPPLSLLLFFLLQVKQQFRSAHVADLWAWGTGGAEGYWRPPHFLVNLRGGQRGVWVRLMRETKRQGPLCHPFLLRSLEGHFLFLVLCVLDSVTIGGVVRKWKRKKRKKSACISIHRYMWLYSRITFSSFIPAAPNCHAVIDRSKARPTF
mmetsp:Transcript_39366/g.77474  ORF Transcript_39366/g.77474 Transcript_39366/m.77474 type:complete len:152 (+) Transcript_39366:1-456(+)